MKICQCKLLKHHNSPTFSLLTQNYTQYIPLSIYDLQTWMGSPSIFVYDCSNAGIIVKSFKQFALQREQELEVGSGTVWHDRRFITLSSGDLIGQRSTGGESDSQQVVHTGPE